MNEVARRFLAWTCEQRPQGQVPMRQGERQVRIDTATARAEVIFWPDYVGGEICEMRITRAADGEQVFFLHFLLEDLRRAQELFQEMCETLEHPVAGAPERVLLCCTAGMTTGLFALRMNEVARTLSLGLEFCAMPLTQAFGEWGQRYAAVLLAPQVAHLIPDVRAHFPHTPVFEVPAKIFGAYDAAGAVRLVMHALRDLGQSHEAPLVLPAADASHRILVITLFSVRGGARLGYRLYEGGHAILEGLVRKARVDLRDVEDLFDTFGTRSVDVGDLDAVGIAVPGVTEAGIVHLLGEREQGFELGPHLERRLGKPVFVDNNCNAAVVACYVTQTEHKSICFFRQELGHPGGGFGAVIAGRLLEGLHHFAGEPNHFVRRFDYDGVGGYDKARWSADGMFEIATNVSLAAISLIAPEALYLAVDTVDDMDSLAEALAEEVGEAYVPHLTVVDDYVERVYLGEVALVERRLQERA